MIDPRIYPLIGDHLYPLEHFENLDQLSKEFDCISFLSLSRHKKFKKINQLLLSLIQKAPETSFLLPATIEYITHINKSVLLPHPYTLYLFEFWLIHFAELDEASHLSVRTKLMGKKIPREEYQGLFPTGSGQIYPGSHFVIAHLSPDTDTTIASFWGWVDAFSIRLGTGQHIWSVPGGAPKGSLGQVLNTLLGPHLFDVALQPAQAQTLTAYDLVSSKNFFKYLGNTSISTIDHGSNEKAIVLINDEGRYLGDWRSVDTELVRQVIILFKSLLHWFENNLHNKLISLFSKQELTVNDIPPFLASVFDVRICDCEAIKEFHERQLYDLNLLIQLVIKIPNGIQCSYRELAKTLHTLGIEELSLFINQLESISHSALFNAEGNLIEERTLIFNILQSTIIQLDIAIHCARNYMERLDVGMEIKNKIIAKETAPYASLESSVDELRLKMKHHDYITVVIMENDEKPFPVGIVWNQQLRKSTLGTVTLRDFSCLEEARIAPYLNVISSIDHHRSNLSTITTPTITISDTQSSNTLLAEIAFAINDRHSTSGLSSSTIDKQLALLAEQPLEAKTLRIRQRLLQKAVIAKEGKQSIHPDREYTEYLSFLYAIIDDTSLLTKVTPRDALCVAELLNRLKTLIVGEEVEIIQLQDLPRNSSFAKKAAQRILQQPDMYSIYHKLYTEREKEIREQITQCKNATESGLFDDTKVQNGNCRVGQMKLFASSIGTFKEHREKLLKIWTLDAHTYNQKNPEVDFHLHMVSTVPSAEEVFKGQVGPYTHQDELWFWIPDKQEAKNRLVRFLLSLQETPTLHNQQLTLAISTLQKQYLEIQQIFKLHFLPAHTTTFDLANSPCAILYIKAGTINSRKTLITPHLPKNP